jgi:hypothetical protein
LHFVRKGSEPVVENKYNAPGTYTLDLAGLENYMKNLLLAVRGYRLHVKTCLEPTGFEIKQQGTECAV